MAGKNLHMAGLGGGSSQMEDFGGAKVPQNYAEGRRGSNSPPLPPAGVCSQSFRFPSVWFRKTLGSSIWVMRLRLLQRRTGAQAQADPGIGYLRSQMSSMHVGAVCACSRVCRQMLCMHVGAVCAVGQCAFVEKAKNDLRLIR